MTLLHQAATSKETRRLQRTLSDIVMRLSHWRGLLLSGLALAYGLLLARFYVVMWYPPDIDLYHDMARANLPARDGFSALFWTIARAMDWMHPIYLNLAALVLMVGSLTVLAWLALTMRAGAAIRQLMFAAVVTTPLFYYLYGKHFYDLPFIAATLAALLLALRRLGRETDPQRLRSWVVLIAALAGFCLSWKPYALFAIAGPGAVLLSQPELRRRVRLPFGSWFRLLLIAGCCAVMGYLGGNYQLPLQPEATLTGIAAYPARSDPWRALFTGQELVWDHIANLPFHQSTMPLPTALVFLLVLPVLARQWTLLGFNLLVGAGFVLFLARFSPGFSWHGFAFGLYILVSLLALAEPAEELTPARRRAFLICGAAAVALQAGTTFFRYIPQQLYWMRVTEDAVAVLDASAEEIAQTVTRMAATVPGRFQAYAEIKRHRFTQDDAGQYTGIWLHESRAPEAWRALESLPNYDIRDPEFILLISPDAARGLAAVQLREFQSEPLRVERFTGGQVELYKAEPVISPYWTRP